MGYYTTLHNNDTPPKTAITKLYDYDGSGNLIYEGFALSHINPLAANTVWAIRKNSYNGSGQLTGSQWSGGNSDFSNTWTGRVAATYL